MSVVIFSEIHSNSSELQSNERMSKLLALTAHNIKYEEKNTTKIEWLVLLSIFASAYYTTAAAAGAASHQGIKSTMQ